MSQLTKDQLRILMSDLHPERVARRQQGGTTLTFVEAFDVKATLIRIFGFTNFSSEVINVQVAHQELRERENMRPIWDVAVMATVRLSVMGAVYTEASASQQSNPDFGEALDFAVKTAESDALKRAATYLGTQFGLSLYDGGSLREIVRVLFDPEQKALLEAPAAPVSDEAVRVLQDSLGATIVAQEGVQAPETPPELADPDGHEARGRAIEDVPGPDNLAKFGGRHANDPEPAYGEDPAPYPPAQAVTE